MLVINHQWIKSSAILFRPILAEFDSHNSNWNRDSLLINIYLFVSRFHFFLFCDRDSLIHLASQSVSQSIEQIKREYEIRLTRNRILNAKKNNQSESHTTDAKGPTTTTAQFWSKHSGNTNIRTHTSIEPWLSYEIPSIYRKWNINRVEKRRQF